jgi:hypothetical protein
MYVVNISIKKNKSTTDISYGIQIILILSKNNLSVLRQSRDVFILFFGIFVIPLSKVVSRLWTYVKSYM